MWDKRDASGRPNEAPVHPVYSSEPSKGGRIVNIGPSIQIKGELQGDEDTIEAIRATVAGRIGKFARPKRIIWAEDLPKTRSGKIMRRLLRDIAEGRELGDVTTLRDPGVMGQLEERIKTLRSEED